MADVMCAVAEAADVTIRRGVTVTGLTTDDGRFPVPRVNGVTTGDGPVRADLVVDCTGRRSAVGSWLAALGARPPVEEREDCGFIYYGRHFRSGTGDQPPMLGHLNQSTNRCRSSACPATRSSRTGPMASRSPAWTRSPASRTGTGAWSSTVSRSSPVSWRSATRGPARTRRWGGVPRSPCCTPGCCATSCAIPIRPTTTRWFAGLLVTAADLFDRPGVLDRVMALGAGAPQYLMPDPSRSELLSSIA
jgi:hypothetical protein